MPHVNDNQSGPILRQEEYMLRNNLTFEDQKKEGLLGD